MSHHSRRFRALAQIRQVFVLAYLTYALVGAPRQVDCSVLDTAERGGVCRSIVSQTCAFTL